LGNKIKITIVVFIIVVVGGWIVLPVLYNDDKEKMLVAKAHFEEFIPVIGLTKEIFVGPVIHSQNKKYWVVRWYTTVANNDSVHISVHVPSWGIGSYTYTNANDQQLEELKKRKNRQRR